MILSARLLAGWFIVALLVLCSGLADGTLVEPDEGRNAEIAREMVVSGDYLLPRLNGAPYLDKPVAFFALVALGMKGLGVGVLAARLVPLVFSLATALLTGWLARRWFGDGAFWVGALVALAAPLSIMFSHLVIMDSALSFFVTAALCALYLGIEQRIEAGATATWGSALGWTTVAWVAIAFGILTKGPIALLLPLLIATPYALWRRGGARAIFHPVAVLPLMVIVGPWVWAVSREVPDYLRYVIETESWARLTSSELRRNQPVWYFLMIGAVGFFPWWIVAARQLWPLKGNSASKEMVFLRLWLVLPLIFFTLSKSKAPQYILPLVPAIALAVAAWWMAGARGGRSAFVAWSFFGGLLTVFGSGLFPGTARMDSSLAATALPNALVAGIVILLVGIVGSVCWSRLDPRARLIGLSLPLILMPILVAPTARSISELRSGRALAEQIEPLVASGADLYAVESYVPSLSFYLRRTYPVSSRDGRPFRSNYVLGRYPELLDRVDELRPGEDWFAAVDEPKQRLFVVDQRYMDIRAHLEAKGYSVVAENDRVRIYTRR